EAIREAEKAREFFKSAGYRSEELSVLLVIARVNSQFGNFKVAEQAYLDMIPISISRGDRLTEAIAHLEYGQLLADQGRYTEALSQIDERYILSQSLNQKIRVIFSLLFRADLRSRIGDYQEAEADLKDARSLADQSNLNSGALPGILVLEAQMALSRLQPEATLAKTKQAIAQSGSQLPDDIQINAKR